METAVSETDSTQGACWLRICSNTIVYVGVTIFALCGPVGVSVGFEAARFLSATGVGLLIAVASGTFLYSQALRTLLFGNRDRYHGVSRQWRCLRFSFRQRDGHSCLATETGTVAFLAHACHWLIVLRDVVFFRR